jgi:hypothetical protein
MTLEETRIAEKMQLAAGSSARINHYFIPFCSRLSKRNVTGVLLTEDQIQSWINSRTQKKKAKGTPTNKYLEQEARLINEGKSG